MVSLQAWLFSHFNHWSRKLIHWYQIQLPSWYQNIVWKLISNLQFLFLVLASTLFCCNCCVSKPNLVLSLFRPNMFLRSIYFPTIVALFAQLSDSANDWDSKIEIKNCQILLLFFALSAGCVSSPNHFLHHFSVKQERHSWPLIKIQNKAYSTPGKFSFVIFFFMK